MKALLSEAGVEYDVHDPDVKPLTKDELWKIMTLPDGRLRIPFTVFDDTVVLGYDPDKLQQLAARIKGA